MSFTNTLKKDLTTLADAQLAFELDNWERVDSFQRDLSDDSKAWGTLYKKADKKFYLNILTATKALQLLRRAV